MGKKGNTKERLQTRQHINDLLRSHHQQQKLLFDLSTALSCAEKSDEKVRQFYNTARDCDFSYNTLPEPMSEHSESMSAACQLLRITVKDIIAYNQLHTTTGCTAQEQETMSSRASLLFELTGLAVNLLQMAVHNNNEALKKHQYATFLYCSIVFMSSVTSQHTTVSSFFSDIIVLANQTPKISKYKIQELGTNFTSIKEITGEICLNLAITLTNAHILGSFEGEISPTVFKLPLDALKETSKIFATTFHMGERKKPALQTSLRLIQYYPNINSKDTIEHVTVKKPDRLASKQGPVEDKQYYETSIETLNQLYQAIVTTHESMEPYLAECSEKKKAETFEEVLEADQTLHDLRKKIADLDHEIDQHQEEIQSSK